MQHRCYLTLLRIKKIQWTCKRKAITPNRKLYFHWNARQYLNNAIPNRWIERNGPVAWLPRSPDTTPLEDFFLWGYMMSLIYETPVPRVVDAAGKIAENQ